MKLILLSLLSIFGFALAGPLAEHQHQIRGLHSHHHVKVQRYGTPNCEKGSKISKLKEIEADDCVTFKGNEPGFLSLEAEISYNLKGKLGEKEECRLYAYSEEDCTGKEQAMDDISQSEGQCQSQDKLFGRSIWLKCMKVEDLEVAHDFDEDTPGTGGIPNASSTESDAATPTPYAPPPYTEPHRVTKTETPAPRPTVMKTVYVQPSAPNTTTSSTSSSTTSSEPKILTFSSAMTMVQLTVSNTALPPGSTPNAAIPQYMTVTTMMALEAYRDLQAKATSRAAA